MLTSWLIIPIPYLSSGLAIKAPAPLDCVILAAIANAPLKITLLFHFPLTPDFWGIKVVTTPKNFWQLH